MKKVLVFGATGMAGHIVCHYLKKTGNYDIKTVVYRQKLNTESIIVDVKNDKSVANVVLEEKPEIIINCIGILIQGSQSHPDNAIYINAYFPHFLKRMADNIGAKLIHISTDCVFTGLKGSSYTESDFRDADDTYGRSKALGEIINTKDLTIRTSIIGPELKNEGEGLFHWFMNQKGNVNGFTNAIWGGVTTLELAKSIDVAIQQDCNGLVHLSNGEPISKYELLQLFQQTFNKNDVMVIPVESKESNKSIAKSNLFDYQVPTYETMIIQMKEWMLSNIELYRERYF